jgi:hypothetical protein
MAEKAVVRAALAKVGEPKLPTLNTWNFLSQGSGDFGSSISRLVTEYSAPNGAVSSLHSF